MLHVSLPTFPPQRTYFVIAEVPARYRKRVTEFRNKPQARDQPTRFKNERKATFNFR
jgi:hypothetical protein